MESLAESANEKEVLPSYARLVGRLLWTEKKEMPMPELNVYIRSTTIRLGRSGFDDYFDDFFPLCESKSVSRHHATILWHAEKKNWEIICMSKNGMIVDRIFYMKKESVSLSHKSCIKLGPCAMYFLLPQHNDGLAANRLLRCDDVEERGNSIQSRPVEPIDFYGSRASAYDVPADSVRTKLTTVDDKVLIAKKDSSHDVVWNIPMTENDSSRQNNTSSFQNKEQMIVTTVSAHHSSSALPATSTSQDKKKSSSSSYVSASKPSKRTYAELVKLVFASGEFDKIENDDGVSATEIRDWIIANCFEWENAAPEQIRLLSTGIQGVLHRYKNLYLKTDAPGRHNRWRRLDVASDLPSIPNQDSNDEPPHKKTKHTNQAQDIHENQQHDALATTQPQHFQQANTQSYNDDVLKMHSSATQQPPTNKPPLQNQQLHSAQQQNQLIAAQQEAATVHSGTIEITEPVVAAMAPAPSSAPPPNETNFQSS
mmetsp:Transcript_15514/g.23349  ORF Transcript_15514/g.23349 Transcript_15514/m.23349 type:complete len:483 (+) Transcript_15514:25-1473(+)